MKPGRELDALVATDVMGIANAVAACPKCAAVDLKRHWITDQWMCVACEYNLAYQDLFTVPRPYSTDIAAAWKVVEKMEALGFVTILLGEVKRQEVRFGKPGAWSEEGTLGTSAPHAICLAALRALGVEA